MFEDSREYLGEWIFVIVRHLGHADSVEIDLVFLVKRTTLHAHFKHRASGRCRGISKTSKSPVDRENPYTRVTTNPPMQSNRTSSCAITSSSRRNERSEER